MKKLFIAILALAAFACAAKCDYDKAIRSFENRLGNAAAMKGAKQVVMIDNGDTLYVIGRKSKPIRSGKFAGLVQNEKFVFRGCRLEQVLMDKQDPVTKEHSAKGAYHLRENGTFKALCTGEEPSVYVKSPFDGTWGPNEQCGCFDEDGNERPFGRNGCLDDDDIRAVNSLNSNSGGGILGDIMRNGTRVK